MIQTLKELYDGLDWAAANESHGEWLKTTPIIPTEDTDAYESSVYAFRCALLEGAVNNNDRWAQLILGEVWNQACELLKMEGYGPYDTAK